MYFIEMLIAEISSLIGYHLICLTLKAHTLIAPGTSHSVAPINSGDGHLTTFVWASTDIVLFHVFLEQNVGACFELLASQSFVIVQVAL